MKLSIATSPNSVPLSQVTIVTVIIAVTVDSTVTVLSHQNTMFNSKGKLNL